MARLNEANAPATTNANAPKDDDATSLEALEAGELYSNTIKPNDMRTKSRRDPEKPPANYEEVKRSLMRQNRNLARSHSAQSLQVRTLGVQISNLLASNTALKEENIRLKKELRNAKHNAFDNGIQMIQDEMRARLRDMATLVDSLESRSTTELSPPTSPETRKSMCLESMQFRDRPSLKEIMSETQMAIIPEMPTQDIMPRLSDGSVESVELGPPPVVRLDDEVIESTHNNEMPDTSEPDIHTGSINTDTRRRKKDSLGRPARRRSTLLTPFSDTPRSPSNVTTGVKRKLSDRDMEETVFEKDNDEFKYSRKTEDSTAKSRAITTTPVAVAASLKPTRKVLGEKSANLSPKKVKTDAQQEKLNKPCSQVDKRSSRRSRMSMVEPVIEDTIISILEQPLSSISPEPTFVNTKADTPPPEDLSLTSSTSREATRPSRRARASVNYAEPSLVAKMRRPGKEMLDALSGLQDPRNAMSTSNRRMSQETNTKTALYSRLLDNDLGDSRAQTKRSPLPTKKSEDEEIDVASPTDEQNITTSLSLATLMAGARKSSMNAQELSIFDFEDSSPPGSPDSINTKTSKTSRRHSASMKFKDNAVATVRASGVATRRKSMMV